MLATIIKFWNNFWGIIGVLTVLVTLIVGVITLYDRFLTKPVVSVPSVKEYIFGTQYYYVQALTDNSGKVLAYGITTRNINFNPSLTMAPNLMIVDPNDPSNASKYRSGSTKIILGITKFADAETPNNIVAYLGVHDFYYHEEYWFGNPGNYQSYFLAQNESGFTDFWDTSEFLSFFNEEKIDPENNEVEKFRENNVINTFFVTAPFEGVTNIMLRKYLVGPDYNQVRAILDYSIEDNKPKEVQLERLSKLSAGVDISNMIDILGKPIIINDEPTFNIRTDPPLNKQWEEEFKNEKI